MKSRFPDAILDKTKYSRFDQRDNVFGRIKSDEEAPFYHQGLYDQVEGLLDKKEGYSSFQLARALGGWSVYDYYSGAFEAKRPEESNNIMDKPVLEPPTADPKVMTEELKRSAHSYGADSVGITEIDSRWIYSADRDGNSLEHLLNYNYAVVMVVPMNPEKIRESPKFPAAAASAVSYSKMAFLVSCLSEYIKRLGFEAIPMGNDRALSIPLAIEAGLGQLGRNGLLITPEFGSSVKICKVFTNMNLVADRPSDPALLESCRNCKLCSEACEVDAVSDETQPVSETVCPANNRGIIRWPVDHYRCYEFWVENGSDCSSCISACPHTPS